MQRSFTLALLIAVALALPSCEENTTEPTVGDIEKASGLHIVSMACERAIIEESRLCSLKVAGTNEPYEGLFFEDTDGWKEVKATGSWVGKE